MTAGDAHVIVATEFLLHDRHRPEGDAMLRRSVKAPILLLFGLFLLTGATMSQEVALSIEINTPLDLRQTLQGLYLDVDEEVLASATCPKKGLGRVEAVFFYLEVGTDPEKQTDDDRLREEYFKRGLFPLPLCVLAALNAAHPLLDSESSNATHWSKDGEWFSGGFTKSPDSRKKYRVAVRNRKGSFYGPGWWFGGSRTNLNPTD